MTWFTSFLLACAPSPEPAPEPAPAATPAPAPAPAPSASKWVQRSDEELDRVLDEACEASVRDHKPVLLEFSAPWCIDCKKLQRMATEPVLAEALADHHHVVVDIGRFDRHESLVEAFDVAAIAYWVVLQPTDCDTPIEDWPRTKSGTFEVETGDGPKTAESVAAWLTG